MAINPNWPAVVDEIAFNQGYNQGQLVGAQWSSLEGRSRGQHAVSRGKQYELDQCRAGTCAMSFVNTDGALDPSNVSSVYAPNVLPYRPFRKRLQYAPTVNRLLADQATAGDANGYAAQTLTGSNANTTVFQLDWTGASFSNNVSLVRPGDGGQQGVSVYQNTMANGDAAGVQPFRMITSIVPGHTYSFSAYARCVTTGQSPSTRANIVWLGPTGATVSTSSGSPSTLTGAATPAWTRLTVSGTAPASAVSCYLSLEQRSTITANTIYQSDSWQFEEAASVSAWVAPGQSNPLFTGYMERYPQDWNHQGNYGLVHPIAVDSFAILSQTTLKDPLTLAINSPVGGGAGPSFLYKLNDSSSAPNFTDAAGNRVGAQVRAAVDGPGTVTAGTPITAVSSAGVFQGAPGQTVVNLSSTSPIGSNSGPMSAISLAADSNGTLGPGAGTGKGFMRMIAFRTTQDPSTVQATIWRAIGSAPSVPNNKLSLSLVFNSLNFAIQDTGTQRVQTIATPDFGNWHLVFFGVNVAGNQMIYGMDGSYTTTGISVLNYVVGGFQGSDVIGCGPDPFAPALLSNNFTGDLAFVCEWPYVLSAAQVTDIYAAWRTAYGGESSGARYSRILGWANYSGPTALDTGTTTNMGPATNVAGVDALSALQAVTDTENGTHFVAADGTVTFKSRGSRYNSTNTSIAYTYGENTAGGELPYSDIAFDFDTSRLANLATVTQTGTGQQYNASDVTSQTSYGTFALSRDVNAAAAEEAQSAAIYLVQRFKDPHLRIQKISFNATANPAALLPPLMATEINTRVLIHRDPPGGAPQIAFIGWVEKVSATLDNAGNGTWGYEISPADLTRYAQFTSIHSTLHAGASIGNTSISINALADAATNVLRANLTGGDQLVIDIGLAAQETVTVAVGGVASTSPGYAFATVTLTAGLIFNHSINAVVSGVMPSGVTSPTIYDNNAIFDDANAKFAY